MVWDGRVVYKKRKHDEKKEPSVQQGFKAQFSWLADDDTKGWHREG